MIAGRLRPLRVPALVLALLATLVSARPVWGADPITVRSATLANVQSGRCLEIFESFCTVTESVRHGIDVAVAVEPEVVRG